MADLRISQLPVMAGTALEPADPLAIADLSASETRKITAKDLVQSAIQLIDNGSIPSNKVTLTIPPNSIGTAELKDDSVTSAKLADGSTTLFPGAALPANGQYVGQLAVLSSGAAYGWDGGAWVWIGGVQSISVTASSPIQGSVATAAAGIATISLALAPTGGAAMFLAGPATGGGAASYRRIESTDLPIATATSLGVVEVSGGGLSVSAAGALSLSNTVSAATTPQVVTYDGHGLVTGGRVLQASDLPVASAGAAGAVSPGPEFSVTLTGELQHSSRPGAGIATKVQYDQTGHITGALALEAGDIPDLDASKITSGSFSTAQIANRSVTADKLSDYSVSFIQEASPSSITGDHHIGTLWFQESSARLSMFNGNSWMPVGQGALSSENLRFCGLFDASTGNVTNLTQFGTGAGLTVGLAIPAAANNLTGVYLVCDTPGTYAGVSYDAGDWILCLGQARGWERIDTLSGAGGGGGAKVLDDLLDVTVTAPAGGNVLHYNAATAQWVVATTIDGGTY